MAAGYPVFGEKPIVRTEAESLTLAKALAGKTEPPLFIGLVMRSMPIVKEVIARVDGGELGPLISMDATEHLPPEHGAYLARNWRRRAEWGGSFMLDKVCHDFDIFGRLAGARPVRVASFGGRRIFTADRADAPRPTRTAPPPTLCATLAGAPPTTPSTPTWTWPTTRPRSSNTTNGFQLVVPLQQPRRLSERRWYLAGAEGTLIADLVRNRLMVRRALHRGKPERIDYGGLTADAHNGADQAMALDLAAPRWTAARLSR